ncbi:MAG: DUF3391 domain-containing protein [Gammaproteobacteria bacterium]|nr:DUF3391 domain-containing protein [Gammaproteobacteria bacterium]
MKKEVLISCDALVIGMFVSRLDRPWNETRFPFEGILISSPEDIEKFKQTCTFVYVDVEQGLQPQTGPWLKTDRSKFSTEITKIRPVGKAKHPELQVDRAIERLEYEALRKTTYEKSEAFTPEVKTAHHVSNGLAGGHVQLMHDLKYGRDLDLDVVQVGVSDMVDSVIRNPDAMIWVVQLKKLDEYSYSRALGTSVWCATFGRHLGLEKDTIEKLALGGLLLDIGKSYLPVDLLRKKGALSVDEIQIMHSHVELGINVLTTGANESNIEKLNINILQMITTHHERSDGSGYPQRLINQNIPIFGRIAGISDSYDAMTSRRPYSDAGPLNPHEAIADLYELRDSKFQSELVEQFIQTVGLYPAGSLVELNTGQIGVVVEINPLRRLRPKLLLLLDENKTQYKEFDHLDLSETDETTQLKRGLPPGAYGIDMRELFL